MDIETLNNDINQALKNADKFKVRVLRSIKSAILNREKELKKDSALDEEGIVKILKSEVKKREQAAELYKKAEREELLANEKKEIELINSYLPRTLSEDELEPEIDKVITELEAVSMRDMGRVMQKLMQKLGGKADGKLISKLVKQKLSQ